MSDNEHQSIYEKIKEAVEAGKVKMRPRWYFVLRTILVGIGIVLLLGAALYLVSFIVFALHRNGIWFVPAFGPRGWIEFFTSLPWLLIGLSLLFILVLEVLVRKYSFVHRKPLLYSAGAILIFAFAGGFALARTPFHSQFSRFVEDHHVPFGPPLYHHFVNGPFPNVEPGEITSFSRDGFVILNRAGMPIRVIVNDKTQLPFGERFSTGEHVVVFGVRGSSTIEAIGARRIMEW